MRAKAVITYISLEEAAAREAALVHRAEAAEREILVTGDLYDRLRRAAEGLLEFIQDKHPEDFALGGKGYTCPHHIAINEALTP